MDIISLKKGTTMRAWICLFFIIFSIQTMCTENPHFKILHLSFHQGCVNDFKEVIKHFPYIELTSWNIISDVKKLDKYTFGSAIYNMGKERAHRIWEQHADYFNSFDMIVTSDTAPLSRIFLQNNWKKPLLIWVCNRFDYYDGASLDCNFPDAEYYDLIRQTSIQPNVKVISYTPYEIFYARKKNVDWGDLVIKPVGSEPSLLSRSSIPDYVNKPTTIFIIPRLESWGQGQGNQLNYIIQECDARGINTYSGAYQGPDDLTDFKAVILFPYALSNLILFENMRRGIIHLVPTVRFVNELRTQGKPVCFNPEALNNSEFCECYHTDNRDHIVYFDSWDDLSTKITQINFDEQRSKVESFGKLHKDTMLERWNAVFHLLLQI